MANKVMRTLFLIGFLIVGGTSAMEPEKKQASPVTEAKKLLLSKEENARRMAEFQRGHQQEAMEGTVPQLPREIMGEIGGTLHAVSQKNPVLDATLEYTNPATQETVSFKIGSKVKDGVIDLSDKAFGDAAKYLVITTDPSVFFTQDEKKLVILIAPWSLILGNLSSPLSAPFQPIMKDWDEKIAPIGIFWRDGSWRDKSWFYYQIKLTIDEISQKSLFNIVFVYIDIKSTPRTPSTTDFYNDLHRHFKVKF